MPGLGRGLGSLLSESRASRENSSVRKDQATDEAVPQVISPMPLEGLNAPARLKDNSLLKIKLELLRPSPYQPRDSFDNDSLAELAASIVEHGLLEPLLVRRTDDGFYQIICGERRYRACRIANIAEVPCLVRDVMDAQAYALALIENIQREDLNPLEQAEAMQRMLDECSLTQESLAQTLGKSRSAVANYLRLNNLAPEVKILVSQNQLSMGHAKVLLSLEGEVQIKAAQTAVKRGMSVRQLEDFVKQLKEPEQDPEDKPAPQPLFTAGMLQDFSLKLHGAKVVCRADSEHKGRVTLSWDNAEQQASIKALIEALNGAEKAPEV